ncbi:MAG: glycoside hydrolase family 3 C-terminal domain-containing protein, partial [Bacteroidales bacterium]|nr:glycoside hydrolase family 3 C-terminal domain-containing protein [Bacteroidales bacterium]
YGLGDISILDAMIDRAGRGNITYAKGCEISGNDRSGFSEALRIARHADKVVFVMGEHREMSGEAAARSDIRIPGVQTELLERLVAEGHKVAVVLMNGRPRDLSRESVLASAILDAWFPGSMGGPAVADVLYNDYNPSGKLTMTFPRSVGQVPVFYYATNTGRPVLGGTGKYLSKYIDIPNSPLYPFGYGLSYTTFSYAGLSLSSDRLLDGGEVKVSVNVTNTGKYEGTEVVQLYIRDLVGSVTRPVKLLKGFERITLKPGESRMVEFTVTPDMLSFWRHDMTFGPEYGDFRVFVGSSSDNVLETGFSYL